MLGRDMEKVFHDMDFIALGHEDLDITNREKVFEKFMTVQPDIVINCTGYTNVDKAEEEEELATNINGYAVGFLAKACREIDATFVHFSTDYVFHGDKKQGYGEEDGMYPLNAYGRSKALGEQLICDEMDSLSSEQAKEGKYYIIRTSWLFGRHGKNFVDTMLRIGREKAAAAAAGGHAATSVAVVNDQFGSPTFSQDLAQQVKWLVLSREYPSGVYHITNDGTTSWFEFARAIFDLSGVTASVLPCSSDEYQRAAKRPHYSVLINHKLPKMRDWKESLQEYLGGLQT